MWSLSVGVRPYYDTRIVRSLINDVGFGSRPNPLGKTPPIYVQLMGKCLGKDPFERLLTSA
jgi:hypothetical protein